MPLLSPLKARFQHVLPKRALTALAGILAEVSTPWVKNLLIRLFARVYPIDFSESLRKTPQEFKTFNDFFTRELQEGKRPIAGSRLVSPCDGALAQYGPIQDGALIQAKGKTFSLSALLGDPLAATPWAQDFDRGSFCTIYLAPFNYHRTHAPLDCTLAAYRYLPGSFYSVNANTTEHIREVFSRNERLALRLETSMGPMIYLMVGAMIVGQMRLNALGGPLKHPSFFESALPSVPLEKGEELGAFGLGSTVILIANNLSLASLGPLGRPILTGESLA